MTIDTCKSLSSLEPFPQLEKIVAPGHRVRQAFVCEISGNFMFPFSQSRCFIQPITDTKYCGIIVLTPKWNFLIVQPPMNNVLSKIQSLEKSMAIFGLDNQYPSYIFTNNAGVVKLVDAGDSKSPGPCAHLGSIPSSGTKWNQGLTDC